ncbi:FAD-binding protein [Thermomonospora umbrina]|uniref:FAD/FMN-containing dehydrogenase n=1 Tax=Thermomonospora umbrina TaxID=111806 RepID=A0A3D9T864_9ACTN|nr:FAD-binding protein [Thermomonospora umbrina]REE99961.1 FAD/FMN-containing dehydrogenase [Thermomonospora umbrina]
MNSELTRRKALASLAAGAGAAVLGWNTNARAWATAPGSTTGVQQVPALDGTLLLPADPSAFTEDFGHLVTRQPQAVLTPGSVDDVQKVVRYARYNRIPVAVNGQSGTGAEDRESHSHYGQALVDGGIAIDPKPFGTIHGIAQGIADVDAGVTWGTLALKALESGQTLPVYNDFAHLSIGGTLSIGGLGGTSQRHGSQADHVAWLKVVTGTGELVTCSRGNRRELFEAVLVGGGQYGIIVRAGIRLIPAKTTARSLEYTYTDRTAFLRDSVAIMRAGVVDDQNGYAEPKPGGGWTYRLALGMFHSAPDQPDVAAVQAVLSPEATAGPSADMPFRDWLLRFEPNWAALKAAGFWGGRKPWLMMFVAAEKTAAYLDTVLGELTATQMGPGPVRISPMDSRRLTRPNFMLPRRRTNEFFEVSLIRIPAPNHPDVPGLLAQNRRFYDRAVGLGGKRYLVGSVPSMTRTDWQAHYGARWTELVDLKRQYDPAAILTPGQGIFR